MRLAPHTVAGTIAVALWLMPAAAWSEIRGRESFLGSSFRPRITTRAPTVKKTTPVPLSPAHPPTGRINLDAGLFKPGLLAEAMPADVSSLHDAGRASVKQDAIIAHEFEEGIRGSHEAALEHAPETGLSIKEEARRLLRAQRDRSL